MYLIVYKNINCIDYPIYIRINKINSKIFINYILFFIFFKYILLYNK